jgi:hypothetical protein
VTAHGSIRGLISSPSASTKSPHSAPGFSSLSHFQTPSNLPPVHAKWFLTQEKLTKQRKARATSLEGSPVATRTRSNLKRMRHDDAQASDIVVEDSADFDSTSAKLAETLMSRYDRGEWGLGEYVFFSLVLFRFDVKIYFYSWYIFRVVISCPLFKKLPLTTLKIFKLTFLPSANKCHNGVFLPWLGLTSFSMKLTYQMFISKTVISFFINPGDFVHMMGRWSDVGDDIYSFWCVIRIPTELSSRRLIFYSSSTDVILDGCYLFNHDYTSVLQSGGVIRRFGARFFKNEPTSGSVAVLGERPLGVLRVWIARRLDDATILRARIF